jgi:SHS2 domain-containing protein
MYEFFDHTADLGLRVSAGTLSELFAEAGSGLAAMIAGDSMPSGANAIATIELAGDDLELLLFDWLRELLDRFERRRELFGNFQIDVVEGAGEWHLTASCKGVLADATRMELEHEVKAITYHGLLVERTDNGWRGEVIVDI